MQSLTELYRYGMGPSSSHTLGPRRAAAAFRARRPDAGRVRVTLYGSLSLTGRGHLTDRAITDGLAPLPCEIVWRSDALPFHPNGMRFEALDRDGAVQEAWTVFSVGGGALREEGVPGPETPDLYEPSRMEEILRWADAHAAPIWALAERVEGPALWAFLGTVWSRMRAAIRAGLAADGVLPGPLGLRRKARATLAQTRRLRGGSRRTGLLAAYALAAAEHNAAGGMVVTAPTCGSCGVLPAVVYYLARRRGGARKAVLRALASAGLVGNLIKHNASIAGAEVGCQGEVGAACAMAAAAAAELMGATPRQVEYAAEMGLEHHLGMTCDPVMGLVQIPCIERNALAAVNALACAEYARLSDGRHHISFDQVVEAMNQTGHDLPPLYRETALGGLARVFAARDGATTTPGAASTRRVPRETPGRGGD